MLFFKIIYEKVYEGIYFTPNILSIIFSIKINGKL